MKHAQHNPQPASGTAPASAGKPVSGAAPRAAVDAKSGTAPASASGPMSASSPASGLTPAAAIRRRRMRVADKQAAFSLVRKIVVLALAAFVLFGVVFGLAPMKGGDMEPKLSAGDLLLFYRMEDAYTRNDVVIMERDGGQYVGRLIGMPGDTIEITDAHEVRVNGNTIVETEIFFETEAFQNAVQYPLQLGADEFFLLGDNREDARDSRYFGAVARSELKGKVITALQRMDL